jgi:hypothetical protein
MKNEITFMSGMFDTAASDPPVVNDRHFGRDLALWMATRSKGSEFAFGEPAKSDAGWTETVKVDGETYTLGFGLNDGAVDSDYAEWKITINNPRGWKSAGSNGSASRSRLCDHIHNVLRDERGVREVQWG